VERILSHAGFPAGALEKLTVQVTDNNETAAKKEITISVPECGNSKVELGESCDDGNTNNGDGCDMNCHLE